MSAETKSKRKSSAAVFPAKASAVLEAVAGSMMTALGCGGNTPDSSKRPDLNGSSSKTAHSSSSAGSSLCSGDLAALGYAAWWDCLPASAVGAPHQRDRLFVVARRPPRPQLADARGDVLASKGCSVDSEAVARRKPGTEGQESTVGGRTRLRPSRRTRQPELARQPDGPPTGVDKAIAALFRFPAPPFAPPLAHEPPRTAPPPLSRVRHRAIGNAVVPALGYILGTSIKRIIESEQAQPTGTSV